MNEAEARTFLASHKQAVLSTIRRDGRPQLSNVLAVYRDGKLILSTREATAKYHNLRRDSRASLVILGDSFWQYLVVDGEASFLRLPEAQGPLRDYYRLASGQEHSDWDEYDRSMEQEQRVLVTISVDHLYPLS